MDYLIFLFRTSSSEFVAHSNKTNVSHTSPAVKKSARGIYIAYLNQLKLLCLCMISTSYIDRDGQATTAIPTRSYRKFLAVIRAGLTKPCQESSVTP